MNPEQAEALSGSDFNARMIMSDSVFYNSDTMTVSQIQSFLNSKVPNCDTNGEKMIYDPSRGDTVTRKTYAQRRGVSTPFVCLKNYTQNTQTITNGGSDLCTGSIPGGNKSAARIIHDVAKACNINPQALIVLLQKEQGLVTDDWPWPTQYRTATGYGCPDTAPCNAEYFGFFNQVYQAAQAFQRYRANPDSYNYRAGRNNNIYWHPDLTRCGSSSVSIQNQATAGLYIYTPYRPNQAALNNLFGTGNSCSSYGNRNFWRDFTRWFGSTSGGDFILLRNQDNGRIYVIDIDRNLKTHVATMDAFQAWGFNEIERTNVSTAHLNSYGDGGSLRRLAYERGTGKAHFTDDKTAYHIPNPNMARVWNMNLSGIPWLPRSIFQQMENDRLTPLVKSPVGPQIYMMDEGILRHYPNPATLNAWEINGRSTRISEAHFCKSGTSGNDCDFRYPAGSSLSFPKATSPEDSKIYFISSGNKHWINSGALNSVYPGGVSSVSQFTLNRFFNAPNATPLIREEYDSRVYLLDRQEYRHIGSPAILNHWRPASNTRITTVSAAFLNLLDRQPAIAAFTATDGESVYYMDQSKRLVEESLAEAFAAAREPVAVSPALLNLYPSRGNIGTPYVTSPQTSRIFFINGNGTKHHVGSMRDLRLMREGSGLGTFALPHAVVANIPEDGRVRHSFKVNGENHLFDNGAYRKAISPHWNANTGFELHESSLEWFQAKADLGAHFRIGSQYGAVRNGTVYTAGNLQLGQLWGAGNQSPAVSARLASYFGGANMSPLVRSTNSNNPRIYIYDGQKLYHIPTPAALSNLNGGRFSGTVRLSDGQIGNLEAEQRATYILDAGHGVMDSGSRRHFNNGATASAWDADGLSTYDQRLINLLALRTNTSPVGHRVTSSNTARHYCIENGQKRWLTSASAVSNSSCDGEPVRDIGHNLLIQIPDGPNIH